VITLSERLQLISSLIPDGARICDVGTDHAYLPIALLKSGKVKSAIATDLREKPLASAKINAEKLCEKRLDLRLCDGLSAVKSGEVDTVIIAGMGGEVISGILDRCEWVKSIDINLILQPMTSAEALRDYLAKNGFDIKSETALQENGHIYSVISVVFDGVEKTVDPAYRYIGKISVDTPAGVEYIKKQYNRLFKCAKSLENVASKQTEYKEYKSAVEKIGRLLEGAYAV